MRNYDGVFEVRPSLIGTISTIGGTAVGAPIDCRGFGDVLAILTAGALQGSTGSTVYLDVKVQESASATGTNWTDITNGAHTGTFDFDQITFGGNLAGGDTTGTWQPYAVGKAYEIVGQSPRLRYIRAHATLSGTVGLGPKISVAFLLGRPVDSLYINNATTVGSGNIELTKLL
jgi:hypothetical protein